MTRISIVLTAVFTNLHLVAANPPQEFAALQRNYRAAVDRATKPLQNTYLAELERLKQKYTRESKLEEALFISQEIEAIKGASSTEVTAQPAPVPQTGKKITASEKLQIEKAVTQTLWEVAGARDFWWFDRRGKGVRQGPSGTSPFTWTVNDLGEVCTVGGGDPRFISITDSTKGEMRIASAGGERKAAITIVPGGKEPKQ